MENKEQQNTSIRFQNRFAFQGEAEKRKTFAAKTVKAEYEEFEITAFYAGNRKRKLSKDYSLTDSCRYRVYVTNRNTKARTWFDCSTFQNGIQTEKDVLEAFSFFLTDAGFALSGYQAFCDECGCTARDGRNAYRLCQDTLKKAEKLGIDRTRLSYITEGIANIIF